VGNFSCIPKPYEDALAEYEQFINEDKITGAYARLYCDYLGIVLSILPVFAAVALANLDRKSRMEQLAYSRKISSAKLIFTRYFALVSVLLIPVIITAFIAYAKVKSIYPDNDLDNIVIFKYMVFWLVPNIMTASAVGMLITEIASGLVAIFVQGTWWFASTMAATSYLTGSIGKFTLVMRHNSLSGYDSFNTQWSNITFNRIFFTVLSILAIVLTAFIYELKRKGVFNGFQINMQNFKRKSKT
ncbi:MAG: ABC transporter permease, partial [Oscillospiraceae bacterium]|nr:ABC transporter permease [Oscillospiraceae bacterium]